jgi:hypothetical protein
VSMREIVVKNLSQNGCTNIISPKTMERKKRRERIKTYVSMSEMVVSKVVEE